MRSKKSLSTVIAFAIALALYVLIVTVIPFEKPASSWVAFSFGALSIIVCCAITLLAMLKGTGYTSKVYGLPVLKLGFVYLGSQMAVSLVFFIIGAFVALPAWISLILSIILLGLCAIGVLLTDNVRDAIAEIEAEDKSSVRVMKTFNVDLSATLSTCTDPDLKSQLEDLVEDFKYSDPVSNDQTEEIENTIRGEIEVLNTLISLKDDNAKGKVQTIKGLLATRNAICKSSK